MINKFRYFSLCLVIVLFATSKSLKAQPNIVIFVADDMGMQLGALNAPGVKTPALDRLVKEGTFFTKAFAAFPSCSPSRTSFLTGTYPHEHGITTNVNETLPQLANNGVVKPSALNVQFSVRKNIVSITEALKASGYFTGLTGKFHVSSPEKFPFDYWYRETEADEFFKRAKASGKPFFLDFNVHSPHRPYVKSPNNRSDIDLKSLSVPSFLPNNTLMQQDWSDYLGAVEATDKSFADLWSSLKEAGLDKNTIVIFISDHGPSIHRGKYYEYPFGSQVPVIFSGLNIPKNKRTNELFSLTDLMPTILDFVHVPIPKSVTGKSAKAVIENNQKSLTKYAYTEVSFPRNDETNYQGRGMTDGRYWYIRRNGKPRVAGAPADNYQAKIWGNHSYQATLDGKEEFPKAYSLMQISENIPPAEELFDLANDPWTMNDLSKNSNDEKALMKMRKAMDERILKTNDMEMIGTINKSSSK